ncbi:MAG: hypothetical protein JNL70_24060 [Saprospiraceae bacterium]|nr:hypothetical protein [Saprospiraceae bacterium]
MKKIASFFLLLGCINMAWGQILKQPKSQTPDDFIKLIEKAHNKSALERHKALAFDIEVVWVGKTTLKATITSQTNSGKVKLAFENGVAVYFDGKDVFLHPSVEYKRARFDVLTWHYFFFAPFKLRDKGVNIAADIDRMNDGQAFPTGKMTFATGTGDSPDDWYILYRNPQTNLLEGMAYIVTFGGKKPDEATPNAITYGDWTTFDGVRLAQKWQFREWSDAKGFTKVKGEAYIRNVRWIDNVKGIFDIPQNSLKVDK